jgi:two-component system chemotaxis sensor kinase CheA
MHNDEFFSTFLEEAIDILEDWEKNCLGLERGFEQKKLDALFRSAHNLKGSSRSVGLEAFGGLVHKTEDVISALRVQSIEFSPAVNKTLLQVHSVLAMWRDQLTTNKSFVPETDIFSLEKSLAALLLKTAALLLKTAKEDEESPSNSGFQLFAEDEPKNNANVDLDQEKKSIEQNAIESQNRNATIANKPTESIKAASKTLESIRVPSQKIDALMQLVGELSTQQAIISHSRLHGSLSSKASQNAIQISAKLTKELQHQTLGLRMQTISGLFQRLERTIRDLARDQNKSIEVVLEGEDVELDKSIIERVTDTLVHIVRNAVDHGIEKPEDRLNSQKPQTSTIRLFAYQDSSFVTIQVKDDGRGIDSERVKKKAIEKGLIKATEKIEGNNIYDLLLLPGFSTAEKLSEVSGRGVGLDVVKRAVDSLGGSMTIDSTLHQGSTFSISLPISVSIIDGLVFELENSSYVVPIHEVEEVIDTKMYRKEVMTNSTPMMMVRGRAIAVIQLAAYLPLAESDRGNGSDLVALDTFKDPAFVVESRGHKVALCFERIIGQQSIVVRRLPEKIANIVGFRGSTILSNGEPAIIISPKEFARQYVSDIGDLFGDSSSTVKQTEAG